MAVFEERLVVPGEPLGLSTEYTGGDGVFERQGFLYAAVVGLARVTKPNSNALPFLNVYRVDEKPTIVPKLGDIVLGKVTKVTTKYAKIQILTVGDVPLKSDFPALLRQADVRQTMVDSVEMHKCFRPSDIVRAEVISLGDKNSYYVSTAKNEYGVIFATSVAGATMVPISWDMMQCPKTKMTEHRKVAKI